MSSSDSEGEEFRSEDLNEEELSDQESDQDSDIDNVPSVAAQIAMIPENKSVYNTAALLQKKKEIELTDKKLPWGETMVINSSFTHEGISAEDDFSREIQFYKQALAGCVEAKVRLEHEGIPYRRPDDFFAEMLKTDAHMAKVRQSLLDHQKRIESVEERRRQRELKQFGKKVQVEKEQLRSKQKKSEIEAVKKWRKDQKNRTTNTEGEDIDKILANAGKNAASGEAKKKNLKRKRKDDQYGYGGKQKRAKLNTSESSDSLTGFSHKKNKSIDKDLLPLVSGFGGARGPRKKQSRGPSFVKRVNKR